MADSVGTAVIGAGYWGPNLVRNMQLNPAMSLKWICDRDLDKARRVSVGTGAQLTDDLAVVLADPEVSAIAIATPPSTHKEIAVAALRAGRHVLVEKPLASSVRDGEEIVREAEARDLVLMCDHTYCYTPAVQKIRDIVRSGDLGDVMYVDSVRINLGLIQRDVNVLWDLAPHDLSIFDFILPESRSPIAVSAQLADPIRSGRACIAYVTLVLPGDAVAHIHVNWLSPMKVRQTIVGGSKRILVWDDLQPAQRISVFDRGVDMSDPNLPADDRREALVSYRTGDMIAPALREREALIGVMEEFSSCILEGRKPATDGRSGLRVLEIMEAAERSAANGGTVVQLRESA